MEEESQLILMISMVISIVVSMEKVMAKDEFILEREAKMEAK